MRRLPSRFKRPKARRTFVTLVPDCVAPEMCADKFRKFHHPSPTSLFESFPVCHAEDSWAGQIFIRMNALRDWDVGGEGHLQRSGKTKTVDVQCDDTVLQLKQRAKIPGSYQLVYAGRYLSDDATLASSGIEREATMDVLGRLRAGTLDSLSSIFVSTDNGVFTCKVSLRSTVASAKAAILRSCAGDRGHCDPSDVWLRSGCKALQDDSTLEQCGVCAGATLRLEVRVRGGGKSSLYEQLQSAKLHCSLVRKHLSKACTIVQQISTPRGIKTEQPETDDVASNLTMLRQTDRLQDVDEISTNATNEGGTVKTKIADARNRCSLLNKHLSDGLTQLERLGTRLAISSVQDSKEEVVAALQQQPEEDQRAISSGAGTAQRTSLRDIEEMSIRELNEELTALGGSADGCVEKADIVARLLEARAVHLFPQQAVAQRHAKLCMDPRVLVRKGKLGGINLCDGRLEDQTGHADVNRLRGIFSEHCLSPDSDDEFTPPNNPELRCTPKRELDFVIGKDGMDLKTFEVKVDARPTYDASSLVNERNVQPIAELMKKKEAKRAGLHIAETVALRLYTGKKPIGWRVSLCAFFFFICAALRQLLNHV